jgi:hypothetical protein
MTAFIVPEAGSPCKRKHLVAEVGREREREREFVSWNETNANKIKS